MRAPIIIAVSVASLVAGAAAASAADLEVETSGYDRCCVEYGPEPLVILDDEPGVTMRRWWLPPWRNRHYYPHGRWSKKAEESSKHAARKQAVRRLRSARSFERYWTNPRPYPEDIVPSAAPLLMDNIYVLPRPRPERYPPPAAGP